MNGAQLRYINNHQDTKDSKKECTHTKVFILVQFYMNLHPII